MEDPSWERELERRIRIYEQMETTGSWPGRLAAIDYWALAALAVAFTVGPWMWVH
jgi:hypothetical protein